MKKLVAALFVFAAAVFFNAPQASAVVKLDGRYWFTELDDTLRISTDNVTGTELSLEDDLGVDTRKDFWEGRLTLELGSHKFRYAYMPMKWDGSAALTRSIVFNGQTYSASTQVDSELKFDYHRLGYEYDFIDSLNNKLGVIFEVKYLDGRASIKAPANGIDQTESFKLPLPAVGVAAQVGLPMLLSVGGEITGITLGSDAYLVDGELGVNLKPAPFVVITGGYRIFKLHVEDDSDLVNITVKGPFVQLRADF